MDKIPNGLLQRARRLRLEQTKAEILFWRIVRNRALGGFKFRRQKPIGPYVVDFYCAKAKVAVELDGSGHLDPEQIAHDKKRDKFLSENGVLVLRYSNHQLFDETESVLEHIWEAITRRFSTPPSSCPSPASGRRDP